MSESEERAKRIALALSALMNDVAAYCRPIEAEAGGITEETGALRARLEACVQEVGDDYAQITGRQLTLTRALAEGRLV